MMHVPFLFGLSSYPFRLECFIVSYNILSHLGKDMQMGSILRRRQVNIGYVIFKRMLRTPVVNNRLLLYGNIITRIFPHFRIPFSEPIFEETKRLGGEPKILSFKNRDILIAYEDDMMLNDEFSINQLPNFHLGASSGTCCCCWGRDISSPYFKSHDMDTDKPLVPDEPPVLEEPPISDGFMQ